MDGPDWNCFDGGRGENLILCASGTHIRLVALLKLSLCLKNALFIVCCVTDGQAIIRAGCQSGGCMNEIRVQAEK